MLSDTNNPISLWKKKKNISCSWIVCCHFTSVCGYLSLCSFEALISAVCCFVFQVFMWLWWWIDGGISLWTCPGPTDSCSTSPGKLIQVFQRGSQLLLGQCNVVVSVMFPANSRSLYLVCLVDVTVFPPAVFRVKMNMAACCAGRWCDMLTWRRSSSSAPSALPSANDSRPWTTWWRQVRAGEIVCPVFHL